MSSTPDAGPAKHDALVSFRRGLYRTFTSWSDALFELCDAALCAPGPVSSVPSLSLEPEFSRSHGSLYKALSKGRIPEDHGQATGYVNDLVPTRCCRVARRR